MRMKRLISLAIAAVLALTVAGIAIAHGGGGPAQKTEQVQATFTTTPVADQTATRQCTGVDGTYAITRSVDTGTATGDPRLTGNITIKSKSVVNTTTGLGWSEGKVFTTDPATGQLKGVSGFTAVITQGSKFEGFVLGKVKNPAAAPGPAKAKNGNGEGHGNEGNGKFTSTLRANFSATVAQNGTITGGLGTGGGDNTAIVHGNPCSQPQSSPQNEGEGHGNSGDNGRGGNGNNGEGRRGNR
jgi:hypothetical protein